MTNFENIKSMTAEEFFNFVCGLHLDTCSCPAESQCGEYDSCKDAFVAWLNKEKNT